MDDLDEETPRDLLSRREKRWSMSSSRLEEIVAELMRPIGDLRHSFDTDISSLLEEYLTQAGLHALEADAECDPELGSGGSPVPNFPEVALLLQHSASVYGRKVDCLYQHVLAVSDSLQTTSIDDSHHHDLDATTETPSARRKRKSSATNDFSLIPLEMSSASVREVAYAPPPVLARGLVELEPRVLRPRDVQLRDYAGEPIGLIQDYHLTRPLTEGGLAACGGGGGGGALRGVPLRELQAALEAAAPPPRPPRAPAPPPASPPPAPPPPDTAGAVESECMPPPAGCKVQRKRKSDVTLDQLHHHPIRLTITKDGLRRLRRARSFSPPAEWVARVLDARTRHLRALRDSLREPRPQPEFRGWSSEEQLAAAARVSLRGPGVRSDSDDDGFFEQSSSGESDIQTSGYEGEWSWWAASIARRADVPGMDVSEAASKVLAAATQVAESGIKEGPEAAVPFARVLRRAAAAPADVSRLFLATLFLANAGNVEIVPGGALRPDSFALRVRSSDSRLYTHTLHSHLHAQPTLADGHTT